MLQLKEVEKYPEQGGSEEKTEEPKFDCVIQSKDSEGENAAGKGKGKRRIRFRR
jgi:hypothetical protein